MDTFQQFVLNMGEKAAADHISNSVFYISIGINDYIHYYLFNISNVQNLYPPWNFNQFLAVTIRQEIKVILLYIVLATHNRKKYIHTLPIIYAIFLPSGYCYCAYIFIFQNLSFWIILDIGNQPYVVSPV